MPVASGVGAGPTANAVRNMTYGQLADRRVGLSSPGLGVRQCVDVFLPRSQLLGQRSRSLAAPAPAVSSGTTGTLRRSPVTVSTLGGAHYTASKAGLLGLTRASAKELGKFGITVNAICPGMIDTELTRETASSELLERLAAGYPVPRLGTPLEVADLICFAASEAAGYLTGTSLDINGGDLMM